MNRFFFAFAPLLALAAACGGSTESDTDTSTGQGGASGAGGSSAGAGGSSAGSGGSSAGSGGGTGGTGDACSVFTNDAGPYATTVVLQNQGTTPVYLWSDCSLNVDIFSCADGYAQALELSGACTADCKAFMGCVACGPCPSGPVEVPPGGKKEMAWSGSTYTFGTVMGCTCHEAHQAPAGKYRAVVDLWDTAPGPNQPKPKADRSVAKDFELVTKSNVVVVDVSK